MAVTRVPEGDHLTRPCLPDLRSLEVLRPQVIVTLDAGAVELAEAWCGRTRYASIVDLDPDATRPIEVRPWATTTPGKPLRAIVHPDAPAEEMAGLFRRLVAGPQPGPPTLVTEIRPRRPAAAPPAHPRAGVRPRPAAIRSVGILTGVLDGAGRDRIEAIAARLEIRGDRVLRSDRADDGLLEPVDVLVLRGLPAEPDVLALVGRRRAAARPTVLDLGPDDLGTVDGTHSFGLSGDARALADACGLVTSPSDAWCSELRAAGLAALRLPTPHRTTAPAAPVPALPHPSPTLLWVLDPTDLPAAPAAAALEQAVASLLDDRPGTRVILCGDPRRWPTSFPVEAGASLRSGDPDASVLGETTLILWTPDGRVAGAAGTPAWLLSAAEREIPTLVDRTGAELQSELFPPETAIERPHEPDAWRHAIGWLLDDDATRRSVGADTRRRAGAVDTDEHADRTVQSLLSWALGHDPATATTGAER